MQFVRQPVGDFLQEVLVNGFHERERSTPGVVMGSAQWP
jgi:hypothetical protein